MRSASCWRWGMIVALCATPSLAHAGAIITQSEAARLGLTRAWYAQVGSGRVSGPISHVSYQQGMLLVQTTQGMLSALDGETGRTLWSAQVGPRGHLCTEAAANEDYVAVVNGSMLFVLDRATGTIQWQKQVTGAPGAGPALSATHVFVPMINGQLEAYRLAVGAKQSPWVYKSAGRVLTPPMATGQSVSWTTEKGYFYVAGPEAEGIRYRLETRDTIQSRPGYWTPNLYACSTDGFVYALNEAKGKIMWKFSVGDAIYTSPVAIEDRVYVTCELSGMYCLDTKTAAQLWASPRISQFLSASPTRIYACDQVGRLVVLDAKTGTRLGVMPLSGVSVKLSNGGSDRIFLASDVGAVQCLHEVALKSPVIYTPPAPPAIESKIKVKDPSEKPDKSAKPAEESLDEPTVEGEAPAMEMEDEKPAAKSEDAEDPFKEP